MVKAAYLTWCFLLAVISSISKHYGQYQIQEGYMQG